MITRAMRKHAEYYYVRPTDVDRETLVLRDDEVIHLVKVCRKKIGDSFYAVDGEGGCYECELLGVGDGTATAGVKTKRRNSGEPSLQLAIAMALPKGNGFEVVIEKGTEIGVSRFVPLYTERTVARASFREQRWRNIALAAMKQCGRSVLPEITEPRQLEQALRSAREMTLRLIAHERRQEGRLMRDLVVSSRKARITSAMVVIGPEAGFSKEEIALARFFQFEPIYLGSRRLRSETAAIAAASLLIGFFDEG